jgi:hypothetical protein
LRKIGGTDVCGAQVVVGAWYRGYVTEDGEVVVKIFADE